MWKIDLLFRIKAKIYLLGCFPLDAEPSLTRWAARSGVIGGLYMFEYIIPSVQFCYKINTRRFMLK